MKIVQLTQGSPEWLEYRKTMRNASETAAVLGVSPWLTPYQLWLRKTGRKTQEVSVAMQHGTDLEPAARAAYEAQTGNVMQPLVVQDGLYSASLDGLTLAVDLILEVKCPFRGQDSALWKEVKAGWVPDHYAAQIQHQMMVSGASLAHLWVFDGTQGLLRPVERIEEAAQRIQQCWEVFQGYLDSDTPPPLMDGDTALREDTAWSSAAQAFVAAKQASDAADTALAQARDALVGLAGHPREQGAGVTVTRYWKAGSVDYKKVPALAGVDLNSYRGKGREEVRVTAA
jgi:putative phage-type endonuclease